MRRYSPNQPMILKALFGNGWGVSHTKQVGGSFLPPVYIDSDLVVAGAAAADLITAETRINAGTGLYAGPLGIFTPGPITSLTLVESPLAQFGIMDAVLMSDIINKGIFNTHIHNSPKGPTSPPLTPFFGV